MGEIADMLLDSMLDPHWNWDGLGDDPPELLSGIARPEMPAIKPTDFPEPEELKNVCPFDP